MQNDTIPPRGSEFTNFRFTMMTKKSEENLHCNTASGYKLFLHHPAELPTLATRYIPISFDTIYNIWVTPEIVITSENLESYEQNKRTCVYSYERRLKFFKIYTKHNCRLECIANRTLEQCNCVPYYLARKF